MELITTHSPYILGTVNSLLLAGQSGKNEILTERLNPQFWITPKQTAAYHVQSGKTAQALTTEEELTLIDNALIDGASDEINDLTDFVLDLLSPQGQEDGYESD